MKMDKNNIRKRAGLPEIYEQEEEKKDNGADVSKVIQSLIDTEASDDNEDQGKIVQLLRGLAFSDDPKSDQFMKKLTAMISDKNFGEFTK